MALITTDWFLGSEPDVPATTISVTANAVTEDIVIPASDYYPWDSTAANSALNQLHDALESHSEIASCSAFYGRDRLPVFTCNISYAINSWSDLTIRNILGFTGTEAIAGTTQTPSGLSSYLWSPGRCGIPDAPLNSQGIPYKDTAVGMSGDATVIATTNNTGRKNRFVFRRVKNTRVMTSQELAGEYVSFWDDVVSPFYRFKVYRDITEEDTLADDTQVNLGAATVLGPYKWLRGDGQSEFEYVREISRVELFNTVDIPCILVDDY
jgi:hypothetical protein